MQRTARMVENRGETPHSSVFLMAPVDQSRALVEAIKYKLREFITYHTGLFPPPHQAQFWIDALAELIAEIEENQSRPPDG